MNRNGVFLFFLFLFLSIMLLLQVLGMIQADRLFDRVNRLEKSIQNAGPVSGTATQTSGPRDPNQGDWLVWNIPAEPANLNPITRKDHYGSVVLDAHIFETLLEYDPDTLKLKPMLAESYEVEKDGRYILFRLKEGIYFTDGSPLTADDVIFTFNTIRKPGIDAVQLANYFSNIKEAIKVDGRTVRFDINEPYFKSLEMLSGMPIISHKSYNFNDSVTFNNRRSDPVGTGPWAFEKWDVGRQIVLRRNERYWGKRPAIDKIIFKVITNEVAALQSLRSHELDFMQPSAEQYYELGKDAQFTKDFNLFSLWNPGVGYYYIGWNQENPLFQDARVRRALTHIVDRQSICTQIYKGLAQIVTGPFYLYGNQTDPNIKPWPYDPETAKRLLDEAGWRDTNGDGIRDKNGVPFRFRLTISSGTPVVERVAKLIKDEMAKVGIEMSIDPYEWSVLMEKINEHKFEAMIGGWTGQIEEDPYQIWHSSQAVPRGSNHISYRNPEIDRILEEARRTMDETKRNALYKRMAWILHEQQPYTFLFARPELRLLDKRFHGVKEHKLGLDEREWYVPKELQKY